jgi:hypothetical protein
VVIQAVRAEQRTMPLAGDIRVGPGIQDLEFEYAGLSYVAPDRLRFRYRLDGYDHHWIDAGNRRQAFYTGLAPGDYAFHVQVANEGGVWNEAGATQQISLVPMWYESRWFYAALVMVFLALIYGAHRVRVGQLVRRKDELKKRVDEALAQIKILGGLIPICASCKKIRDDKGYWNHLETYIHAHSEADFTHSICPDCAEKMLGDIRKK